MNDESTLTVDARGLSCPQPVLLTRKALLEAGEGRITVLVDTMTQVYNCTRAAGKLGWHASYEETNDGFALEIHKQHGRRVAPTRPEAP